ncbi:MAG TPA: hypothetical protein VG013_31095 [Gemmataceae bacterium]|jgi:hypothetical protein|nr:hypothetical protein [Gemmataceae bacterium]
MIESMSRLAASLGDQVSRRRFVGWLGASAMAMAGMLLGAPAATAAKPGSFTCCKYTCGTTKVKHCHKGHKSCGPLKGCVVAKQTHVTLCRLCPA